jgi:hypothetical protein
MRVKLDGRPQKRNGSPWDSLPDWSPNFMTDFEIKWKKWAAILPGWKNWLMGEASDLILHIWRKFSFNMKKPLVDKKWSIKPLWCIKKPPKCHPRVSGGFKGEGRGDIAPLRCNKLQSQVPLCDGNWWNINRNELGANEDPPI